MLSKFFALSLLLSSLSFAGEQLDLEVYGRTYLSNCGSVTAEAGDFQIVVKSHGNTPTPWGTRMTLLYGWKGYNANFTGGADAQFDWAYNGEMEMPAIASYTWRVNLTRVLHERTSSQALTHLQFVVRIDAPGRAPYFLNGGTNWGYFQSLLTKATQCTNGDADKPVFTLFPHVIIDKN